MTDTQTLKTPSKTIYSPMFDKALGDLIVLRDRLKQGIATLEQKIDSLLKNRSRKKETPKTAVPLPAFIAQQPKPTTLRHDLGRMMKRMVKEKGRFNQEMFDADFARRTKALEQAAFDGNFIRELFAQWGERRESSVGAIRIFQDFIEDRTESLTQRVVNFGDNVAVRWNRTRVGKFFRAFSPEQRQDRRFARNAIVRKLENQRMSAEKGKRGGISKFVKNAFLQLKEERKLRKKNVVLDFWDMLQLLKLTVNSLLKQLMRPVIEQAKRIGHTIANAKLTKNAKIAIANIKTKITSGVAKIFDSIRIAKHVTSGMLNALLPSAAIYLATGGNPAIAISFFALKSTANIAQKILGDRPSSIGFIRRIQEKWGWGEFYNPRTGRLDLGAARNMRNIVDISSKTTSIAEALLDSKRFTSLDLSPKDMKIFDKDYGFKRLTAYEQGTIPQEPIVTSPKPTGIVQQEAGVIMKGGRIATSEEISAFNRINEAIRRRNIFTPRQRLLLGLNSGLKWGSYGILIGSLLGSLFGFNPTVGAMIGGGIGFGAGLAAPTIKGWLQARALANAAGRGTGFIAKLSAFLAAVPTAEMLAYTGGHLWLWSQIDQLVNKYNWNWKEYLDENFGFAGKNPLGLLGVGFNYAQLALLYPTTIAPVNLVGAIFKLPLISRIAPASATPAYAIAVFAGTVAGILIANALGVPFGAGMIAGGAIGGIAGAAAAATVLAGVSIAMSWNPVGWVTGLVLFVGSAIGAGVGAWAGSKLDQAASNALGKVTGWLMGLVNGIGAIFSFISMLTRGMKVSNLIPFILSLMGLAAALDTLQKQEINNQDTEKSSDSSSINNEYKSMNLNYFNTIIVYSETDNEAVLTRLVNYLDQNYKHIESSLEGRKLVLSLVLDDSYTSDEYVLVSVNKTKLLPGMPDINEYIKEEITNALTGEASRAYGIKN